MTLDARAFKGLSRFLAPSAGGPVADRALAEKLISPAQLQECVEEQDRSGAPLDEILVARGFLSHVVVDRLRQPELPPEVVEASMDPKNVLTKYVLVSRAGEGGMAEVWKAWDRSLNRWVAVKFLKEDVGQPDQRLEREGRMAGGLSHPGIISIYERARHEDGRPYLVMPFVDGRSPGSPLPAREAARVALEVARALEHVHVMKVIHRDIKPANILVGEGGRVMLADFGLAMPSDSPSSRWAVSGTPEYASPEQVKGDVLDAGTDIYSLGATLFHLLEGHPPFRGAGPKEIVEKVLNAPFPPMGSTPAPLATIVRRAMERDRKRRYGTIRELSEALRAFLEGTAPAKGPTYKHLAAVLVVGLLPWFLTWLYMLRERARDAAHELERPLTEAASALAKAEELAAEEEPDALQITATAERALSNFRRAMGLSGKAIPEAYAGMGRAHELQGYDGRALEAWERAGDLPAARLGVGRSYLRRHFDGRREFDWKESALKEFQIAGTGLPEDPSPALALFCEDKWAEALRAAAPAWPSRRGDDVFQVAMGVAAGQLKQYPRAMECFEQALRVRPHSPWIYFQMAAVCEAKGDREDAAAYYQAAIDNALPGWTRLKDAQARLAGLR